MAMKGGKSGRSVQPGACDRPVGEKPAGSRQDERSARLAQQLRANLRRRKAAARARDGVCDALGDDDLPQAGDGDQE